MTSTTTLQRIKYLENENIQIKKKLILHIKATEKSEYQQHLTKIISNHGYHLRKPIISLTTSLNNFLTHLQLGINIWNQHTTLILKHETSFPENVCSSKKKKVSTSNKAPNFTSINMPSELTELLNKGTYFIPTSDKIKISAIKKTISSEIDSTLCQIIKSIPQLQNLPPTLQTNFRYQSYFKRKPTKLPQEQKSKPNFNLHIFYFQYTTLYTKLFLQSYNLQNLTNPQQLNITQTYTYTISTFAMTILTKTDKNMGWALITTSLFTNKYTRHFTDTTTYR